MASLDRPVRISSYCKRRREDFVCQLRVCPPASMPADSIPFLLFRSNSPPDIFLLSGIQMPLEV
jgi:hypothetical protein